MRSRKRPNHKRRLAYARSGLMFNLKGSQESEFWSFPLPPMSPSPGVSGMGQSNQSEVNIHPRKPEVQVSTGLTMENYYGSWHWHCTLTDSCCACTAGFVYVKTGSHLRSSHSPWLDGSAMFYSVLRVLYTGFSSSGQGKTQKTELVTTMNHPLPPKHSGWMALWLLQLVSDIFCHNV